MTQDIVEKQIDEKIGEVRTDAIDLTFGELLSLHKNRELIVAPEFQRLFRWSETQQSRLVESILLELPIPQITVIENEAGVLELIDGLQRVTSVLRLMEPESVGLGELTLQGCELLEGLNGKTFKTLPLRLQLRIKRAPIRTVVIKRQSLPTLKFEMFRRLNTGGLHASPQEIRNCTSRMVGEAGTKFFDFIAACARENSFLECTSSISEASKEERLDEELALRFFAIKNARGLFNGSVSDWLDSYMEQVILAKMEFQYDAEKAAFLGLFGAISAKIGDAAFVRYKDDRPIGSLAPAYFEAVTMGVLANLEIVKAMTPEEFKRRLIAAFASAEFRASTGPGANSKQKLERRIAVIAQTFNTP